MTSGQSSIVVEHRLDAEGVDPLLFTGVNDTNLQEVSKLFGIRLVLRGDHVILSGELTWRSSRRSPVVQHLIELSRLAGSVRRK